MARGGFRSGAGRPKTAAASGGKGTAKATPTAAGGSGKGPDKAKVKRAERVLQRAAPAATAAAAEGGQGAEPTSKRFASALEFAMDTINDPEASLDAKIRLAVAALPFQHPKLEGAATGKKEQRQLAADAAASGKFAPPAPPKLVVDNGG